MSIYQSDPDAAPDSEFEPGTLQHLVIGNAGRMLDPRRTPVTIVDLHVETGFILFRLDAFEDAGATWEIPFEEVGHFQFAQDSDHATGEAIDAFRDAIERLDRPLVIEPDPDSRDTTEEQIEERTAEADTWLNEHSRFLASGRRLPDPASRRGDGLLAADLESFMRDHGLWGMEEAFAHQYVRNPHAGELVKAHLIVMAECGLGPYVGTIIRDPATFRGEWSRARRTTHVWTRLGFLRALFARLHVEQLELWRGFSPHGPLDTHRRDMLISATFNEAVARSHLAGGPGRSSQHLVHWFVPAHRVFMTYLETKAMNEQYLEAEAVLLPERDQPLHSGS